MGLELLAEAEQLAFKVEQGISRAGTLAKVAFTLAEVGEWFEAWRVVISIKHHNLGPRTRKKITEHMVKTTNEGQALKVLVEVKRILVEHREVDYFLGLVLGDIAVAVARAGEWNEALGLTKQIEDNFKRAQALTGIAQKMSETGEYGQALEVLAQERSIINEIENSYNRASALKSCVEALLKANEHKQAIQLVQQEWERANTRPEAFSMLLLVQPFAPFQPELGQKLYQMTVLTRH